MADLVFKTQKNEFHDAKELAIEHNNKTGSAQRNFFHEKKREKSPKYDLNSVCNQIFWKKQYDN